MRYDYDGGERDFGTKVCWGKCLRNVGGASTLHNVIRFTTRVGHPIGYLRVKNDSIYLQD